MEQITQVIRDLPAAPDSANDTPQVFNDKANAFVKAQKDNFVGDVNAWAAEANTLANSVNTAATNAATSETNAKASETNAAASESNAKASETNAATSESNAKTSETNAKTAETNADMSAINAAASENNAKAAETAAQQSADAAEVSALAAEGAANYQGDWAAGVNYAKGQSVSLNNVFYYAKADNVDKQPDQNPAEWQVSNGVEFASQDEVDAGIVADKTVSPNTLANVSYFQGRNMLINGNLFVWQRGTTFSSTPQFVADRWWFDNAGTSGSVVKKPVVYAIDITLPSSSDEVTLRQRVENYSCADVVGTSITVSFVVDGTNLSDDVSVEVNLKAAKDGKDNWTNTVECGTVTVTALKGVNKRYAATLHNMPTEAFQGLQLGLKFKTQGSETVTLSEIQMEKGSVATTFEMMSYADTERLCNRYYAASTYVHAQTGNGSRSRTLSSPTYFPVKMRSVPTVTITSVDGTADNVTIYYGGDTLYPVTVAYAKQESFGLISDNSELRGGASIIYNYKAEAEL